MTDYEIWLAYTKANLKVGLIIALIMSPFVILYAYHSYKRIKELKDMMDKMDKRKNDS